MYKSQSVAARFYGIHYTTLCSNICVRFITTSLYNPYTRLLHSTPWRLLFLGNAVLACVYPSGDLSSSRPINSNVRVIYQYIDDYINGNGIQLFVYNPLPFWIGILTLTNVRDISRESAGICVQDKKRDLCINLCFSYNYQERFVYIAWMCNINMCFSYIYIYIHIQWTFVANRGQSSAFELRNHCRRLFLILGKAKLCHFPSCVEPEADNFLPQKDLPGISSPGPRFTHGFSIAIQMRWKYRFTLISILI